MSSTTSRTPRATPTRWRTIADAMIADGVTVLAIVNLDSDSGAAIQQKAAARASRPSTTTGSPSGGSADYYVSFDNTTVGELQGQGLVRCLGRTSQGNIVFLNGSPTDNNATLFSQGAHSVLDARPTTQVVAEQAVPDWDNEQAGNDLRADVHRRRRQDRRRARGQRRPCQRRSSRSWRRTGVAGQVPVTGQDATVEGLQNILAGTSA